MTVTLDWFRDYDWDHYRSMGRGTHYETSSADGGWSVAMTHPCFVPLGKANTLDKAQALAQAFEAKPMWLKKRHGRRHQRRRDALLKLTLREHAERTGTHHRGFWATLWFGQGRDPS